MWHLNVERSSTSVGFVFACTIHFAHPGLYLYFKVFIFIAEHTLHIEN